MPYAQTDLEKFVSDLGLPAEKAKLVMDAIGSDGTILTKFGDSVLRQSDYSAKMDALKVDHERLEREYQTKKQQEDEFHAGVATWKTEKEKEVEAVITKSRREAEDRLNAARDKIRTLATTYGVPEDAIKDVIPASVQRQEETRDDRLRDAEGRYITVEQLNQILARESQYYAKLPGMQMSMEREYYQLFGNDAPAVNWEKVIDAARTTYAKSQHPFTDAFNETYKINEKRQEITAKRHQDEVDRARKEGEESARSKMIAEHPEMSRNVITRERPGSPILERGREQQRELEKTGKIPARVDGPRETVSAAVAAFNDGKYKPGQTA